MGKLTIYKWSFSIAAAMLNYQRVHPCTSPSFLLKPNPPRLRIQGHLLHTSGSTTTWQARHEASLMNVATGAAEVEPRHPQLFGAWNWKVSGGQNLIVTFMKRGLGLSECTSTFEAVAGIRMTKRSSCSTGPKPVPPMSLNCPWPSLLQSLLVPAVWDCPW